MKKLSAVLFLTALASLTVSAAAFRADIAGLQKDGKVKLTPGEADGMTIGRQTWRSQDEQPYTLNVYSGALPAGEWSDCTIAFTADESGTIRVEVKGQWHKDPASREWLKIGPVTVNGKPLPNADYSVTDPKNGKAMPRGFWLNKKADLLPGGGPDGKAAVLVNHDNTLVFSQKVEAGKSYTIVVKAMPGEPPAAK